MARLFSKPKIGLALSGGAARGLAHIGVIKAFQEEGIEVSFIAGASVGSLIGALYAAGMSWSMMADIARKIKWKDLAQITLSPMGIAKHAKLKKIIDDLISGKRFEDLSIPFAAVAVDITSGEEVVLKHGSVAEAVRASSSLPGIFEPTVLGGRYLVDGGLLNNMPADVVRSMGADIVVAVELNAQRGEPHPPKNILDILYRCFMLVLRNSRNSLEEADFIITPQLEGKSYADLKPLDEMIELGEAAARFILPSLKKKARLK
jgi:NTE family protein